MKKKYYILALTFLCMLVGQKSFGQTSGGDYDYSNIDNFIDDMLAANPDIDVDYYSNLDDYVNAVNDDDNPNNDFTDTNGDGQINEGDDLYRQNLINNLGMNDGDPVNCTDAELQALWESGIHLRDVVVINNYHDSSTPADQLLTALTLGIDNTALALDAGTLAGDATALKGITEGTGLIGIIVGGGQALNDLRESHGTDTDAWISLGLAAGATVLLVTEPEALLMSEEVKDGAVVLVDGVIMAWDIYVASKK